MFYYNENSELYLVDYYESLDKTDWDYMTNENQTETYFLNNIPVEKHQVSEECPF